MRSTAAEHGVARYGQIFSRNLVTWFNAMVAPAAIALLFSTSTKVPWRSAAWPS